MSTSCYPISFLEPDDVDFLLSDSLAREQRAPNQEKQPLHARLQSLRNRIPSSPPFSSADLELQALREENAKLRKRCLELQATVEEVEHELEQWELLDTPSPYENVQVPQSAVNYTAFNRAICEALAHKNKGKTDELFAILKVLSTPPEQYLPDEDEQASDETRALLNKQISETNLSLLQRVQELVEELGLPDLDLDTVLKSMGMERWELDFVMVEPSDETYLDYMAWWYSLKHHAGRAEGAIDNVSWAAGKVTKAAKAYKWACALLAFTQGPITGTLALGTAILT